MIRNRHSSGFLLADALGALFLVGVAMSLLAVATFNHRHAQTRIAHREAALHLADRLLMRAQSGNHVIAPPDEVQVSVEPLQDQASAPPAFKWVRIRVVWEGQAVSLVGLVRKDAS